MDIQPGDLAVFSIAVMVGDPDLRYGHEPVADGVVERDHRSSRRARTGFVLLHPVRGHEAFTGSLFQVMRHLPPDGCSSSLIGEP